MRELRLKRTGTKYEAGNELAKLLLNHLIGKESLPEAQLGDVVDLAAIHEFKAVKVEEEGLYGYCPLCECVHKEGEECPE